jgi:SAM-dependent methyltransferase
MADCREQLRTTFDRSAGWYDRIRPSYPDALVEDVIDLSGIPSKGRILEIGCGTGKATELFASRGYAMDCLEIGPDLAAVASAKLARFGHVRVVVSSFEEWEPGGQSYDLVIAATSFHWVDPRVAYVKSAAVLKPGCALAVFSNTHVRQGEGFFDRVQDVYRACAPSMLRDFPKPEQGQSTPVGTELFEEPLVRRYPWSVEYSADRYTELLGTYSDHISLPAAERSALFRGIADLIRDEYGGRVRKHYEAVLTLRKVIP